jgi:hypothetical protein
VLLSTSLNPAKSSVEQTVDVSTLLAKKAQLIASLSKGLIPKALKLMVAMSALLSSDDYRRIGPLLWDHHLNGADPTVTASVRSFLYSPLP